MSLPKEIAYSMKPSQVPNGTITRQVVSLPVNGSVFADNSQPSFQLIQSGCLVPTSMYIRYRQTVAGQSADTDMIGSFPAYSPFYRLETKIGGITYESISDYGRLCQALLTTKLGYAAKVGLAPAMGIGLASGQTDLTFQNCNGADLILTSDVRSLSAPLNCLLSNAEKFIPLFLMPLVEITFTLDAIANITKTGTTAATSISLSNFELVYEVVDFPEDVKGAITSMVDERGKLVIKSQSYLTSSQTVPSASSGSLEYIYSMRLASIKSLLLLQGGTHANAFNKLYDSFDNTSNNGSYCFLINGVQYPSRELSTVNSKSAIISELVAAVGGQVHNLSNSELSITPKEFSYINTSTSTILQMGKFFVGVNTEKLSVNNVMLSGVSSQNSPISLRLALNTSTTNTFAAMLCANFDAIIEVDVANRQCAVLQ